MRELKFRGKDSKENWVYGYFIHFQDLFRKREAYKISTGFSDSMPDVGGYDFCADYEDVNPETVGQFTGVKDVNGREIYEGDIVRVRVTNDRFKKNPRFRNGVVSFCEYDGGWTNGCYHLFIPKRMEVIGNIHDDPELLEGGEK